MIVSPNPLTFRFEISFKYVVLCKEKDTILKNENIRKIIFESLFDYVIASFFYDSLCFITLQKSKHDGKTEILDSYTI